MKNLKFYQKSIILPNIFNEYKIQIILSNRTSCCLISKIMIYKTLKYAYNI